MRISPFAASYVRKRTREHMVDACRIWKPGPVVLDRDTGKATRGEDIVKYVGPCRFWEVPNGNQALIGDQEVVFTQSYLTIPYDAPVPEFDDIVKITASVDQDLVGRTIQIVSTVRGGGLRASRRFLVQVVESNKEKW